MFLPHKPTYYVHFSVWGNGTEWLDAGLPTPNYFYHFQNVDGILGDRYGIGYIFDGMFTSKKSIRYLNDMIQRFIITLPIKERLMYRPDVLVHGTVNKLEKFQNLESIPRNGRIVPNLHQLSARHNTGRFWETKLWIEQEIKRNGGEGSPISFDMLIEVNFEYFKWKDLSTCRSFCRNLWNWYDKRDWEYHILNFRKSKFTEEEIMANRITHINQVNANKIAKTQAKIKAVLADMFVREQVRTKSGKPKAAAIANILEMDSRTVSKHLKEMSLT